MLRLTRLLLPAIASAKICFDQWAVDYPNEKFLLHGHSCYQRKNDGSCDTVLESCAETCELCSEERGVSAADALAERAATLRDAALDFEAVDGQLRVQGKRFDLRGINWFGPEAEFTVPMGLHTRSMDDLLHFLASHGFNAIRIPFNHASVLEDAPVRNFDTMLNPQLVGTSYLDALLVLAKRAAYYRLLLLITCHRLSPEAWPGSGLWYDETITEAKVLLSWTRLTSKLCGQWNVFGADLHNEPHQATWGRGWDTDWNLAAGRIGNHVLARRAHSDFNGPAESLNYGI